MGNALGLVVSVLHTWVGGTVNEVGRWHVLAGDTFDVAVVGSWVASLVDVAVVCDWVANLVNVMSVNCLGGVWVHAAFSIAPPDADSFDILSFARCHVHSAGSIPLVVESQALSHALRAAEESDVPVTLTNTVQLANELVVLVPHFREQEVRELVWTC